MFPKIKEMVIKDSFNKSAEFSINIGKHVNSKNIFKYRVIVYHKGKEFIRPLECKNFKTYEEAEHLFTSLVNKYMNVGKVFC